MGQSQGSHAIKQFSNNALKKFQEHYTFHCEKNDERWGVIQVWKEKGTTSEVMLLSKNFHDDQSFKEFLAVLKTRQALEHPNLVQFLGWSNEDADGICGQNRKFHLYVEYLSQNLEKEISRRTAGKVHFAFHFFPLKILNLKTLAIFPFLSHRNTSKRQSYGTLVRQQSTSEPHYSSMGSPTETTDQSRFFSLRDIPLRDKSRDRSSSPITAFWVNSEMGITLPSQVQARVS